jgi:hypothetical protein
MRSLRCRHRARGRNPPPPKGASCTPRLIHSDEGSGFPVLPSVITHGWSSMDVTGTGEALFLNCPRGVLAGALLAPTRPSSCADAQHHPILYSLIPECRGASREQSREHRGFRSRPVADASGAPVLRDQGPIGRPGTARPIQAVTPCMPWTVCRLQKCSPRAFAQVNRQAKGAAGDRGCPWLSLRHAPNVPQAAPRRLSMPPPSAHVWVR